MQIVKSWKYARFFGVVVVSALIADWMLISHGKLLYAKSVSEYAVAQEQGRAHQDAHATHREFKTGFGTLDYFAVFDGHGGLQKGELGKGVTHAYARDHLHEHLQEQLVSPEVDPLSALTAAFIETDRAVCVPGNYDGSGSTASVMGIDSFRNKIYVANVGDSPIVLAYRNGTSRQISVDHNAENKDEVARVKDAKIGDRLWLLRFAGVLAVSRALGNCNAKSAVFNEHYKTNMPGPSVFYSDSKTTLDEILTKADEFWISPFPSVQSVDMTPDLEFAVIASDGVIDGKKVTSDAVVRRIRKERALGHSLQKIANQVIAASNIDGDDKTMIIVYFQD